MNANNKNNVSAALKVLPDTVERMRSGILAFRDWWTSELAALLPPSLARIFEHYDDHVLLEFHDNCVKICLCSSGKYQVLGEAVPDVSGDTHPEQLEPLLDSFGTEGIESIICLAEGKTLKQTLSLPIEAEENLPEVIGYEIERHTPFPTTQVYFDFEILKRNSTQRRIDIRVTVAPRNLVDELCKRVNDWGLVPAWVTTLDDPGLQNSRCATPNLNLLPTQQRKQRAASVWTNTNYLLAASAVCLLAAVLVTPFLRQHSKLESLERQIDSLETEAELTRSLRTQLDRLIPESRFILEQKRNAVIGTEVLNELTQILPDDTWIQRFQLKDDRINLQGESAHASGLIELVENSDLFNGAAFDTLVARNQKSGKDRFQLSADIVRENQQ